MIAPDRAPAAPWRLVGEVVLGWVKAPKELRSLLPAGVSSLPGRAALVAVRYTDSPVGPYLELSLALPARIGLRPGLCVVFQIVSSAEARLAYRANWGLPATVGPLTWSPKGHERVLRCEEPGIEVRGLPVGPTFPAIVPVRSVQRRSDGPVVLPRRFLSLVRLARTTVAVADSADGHAGVPLHGLAGVHPGAVMAGARILARPARHPAGLWSSLRAPLAAPEPALTTGVAPPAILATVAPRTGRLAQLVRAQPSHG